MFNYIMAALWFCITIFFASIHNWPAVWACAGAVGLNIEVGVLKEKLNS